MADTTLGLPSLRTLRYVLDKARIRFGQTDPRLENQIVPEITDRLIEICAEYPYWFLRVDPDIPTFPVPQSTATGWLYRGWYLIGENQKSFPLQSVVNQTSDITLLVSTECRQLNFVKCFDLNGSFLVDMMVSGGDEFWSKAWVQQPDSSITNGMPRIARPYSVQLGNLGGSTVQIAPQADQKYMLCVGWDMAHPPWFQHNNSVTNVLLIQYPRLIEMLVYIQYAEFFKEWEIKEKCEREIWGDAQGRVAASIPNWGIIGRMKLDTQARMGQQTTEMEWHQSARDALGRGGGYQRNLYDPYYYGNTPY